MSEQAAGSAISSAVAESTLNVVVVVIVFMIPVVIGSMDGSGSLESYGCVALEPEMRDSNAAVTTSGGESARQTSQTWPTKATTGAE
jgi:hypothetical protein